MIISEKDISKNESNNQQILRKIGKILKIVAVVLVVLGILGRTGISAAFLGNTAEHVIDKLKCDLLAIKPDGFVCPITPADED